MEEQALLDDRPFFQVTEAFVEILDVVYERPAQRAAGLKPLHDADKSLKQ